MEVILKYLIQKSHEKTISENNLLGSFKSITTADRNYKNRI